MTSVGSVPYAEREPLPSLGRKGPPLRSVFLAGETPDTDPARIACN